MFNIGGFLSKILANGTSGTPGKDPISKRPEVAPTTGGGMLEQYGIFTPAQKAQMQDEQQQQQDLLMSQLQPSQRSYLGSTQLGRGLGSGIRGLLQSHGMLGGQPQQAAPQSQGDPQAQFTQYVQQTGGDVPKAMKLFAADLIKSPNPDMQNAGIKMLQDAQTQILSHDKDQAQIGRDTTQADQNTESANKLRQEQSGQTPIKNGELQTVWDGTEAKQVRYNAATKKWEVAGHGERNPTQRVVSGTPDEWNTKGEADKALATYRNLRLQGRQITGSVDNIIDTLQKNPGSAGRVGDITLLGKNFVDTAKGLFTSVTGTEPKPIDTTKLDYSSIEKSAIGRAVNKGDITDAAYAYALMMYGQKGTGVSDKDVQRVLDRLGSAYSDPNLGIKLMQDLKSKMSMYVNNYADINHFDRDSFFNSQEPPKSAVGGDEIPADIQEILKKHRSGG